MNWIRENRFLAVFIGVLVVGAGVLGYLLFTAWGVYAEVTDQYTQQSNELHRLQSLIPYPDQANLAKYRAEHDDLLDATGTLASNLATMVLPVNKEMTPSQFQDQLRDTLTAIKAKAAQARVKLPDHFALDFDQYQTQPPSAEAAPYLGRQLAALDIATGILINDRVDDISKLTRTKLPQETGGHGGGGGGGRFGHGGGALVEKFPFDIQFTSDQSAFRKVLNDIAASSKQFFITRAVLVENTIPKPVAKETPPPPPTPDQGVAAGAPAPGTPATSGSDNYLKFVVGGEKLDVAMRVDMVVFNPPERSNRKR